MTWRAEYRALHSDFEYRAEYRPGGPNIELYIRMLNIALNIDLGSRIYRALHFDVEHSAEYRPGGPNIELYIQILNIVLNIDLEGRI